MITLIMQPVLDVSISLTQLANLSSLIFVWPTGTGRAEEACVMAAYEAINQEAESVASLANVCVRLLGCMQGDQQACLSFNNVTGLTYKHHFPVIMTIDKGTAKQFL